jgi:hypothetical protein
VHFSEVTWDGPIRHQENEIAWGTFMSLEELGAKLNESPFVPDDGEIFSRWLSDSDPPDR